MKLTLYKISSFASPDITLASSVLNSLLPLNQSNLFKTIIINSNSGHCKLSHGREFGKYKEGAEMHDIIIEAFRRGPLLTVSLRLVFFFCLLILSSINGETSDCPGNVNRGQNERSPGMSFGPIFCLHLGLRLIIPDGYSQSLLEKI